MARFTSTRKRNPPPSGTAPATPASLAPASARAFIKRPLPSPDATPTKKQRLSPTSSTIIAACDTDDSLSQDIVEDGDGLDVAPPMGQSAADPASSKTPTSDLSRPQRIRQPPKKFQEPT
ncbi:hypothetical protein HIM_10139 [Hirsutella minnesotensis 3608]|uniref:Uncharacterized protein n=1 Tax=Hirsutella minnesotensis 3608 TaxID=1043627 RepID=A0A0F7ZXC2_9HYPO|nr:hypothetical protein HIM_10139 [Hirsutella minnesotensis 3608]